MVLEESLGGLHLHTPGDHGIVWSPLLDLHTCLSPGVEGQREILQHLGWFLFCNFGCVCLGIKTPKRGPIEVQVRSLTVLFCLCVFSSFILFGGLELDLGLSLIFLYYFFASRMQLGFYLLYCCDCVAFFVLNTSFLVQKY